MLSDFLTLFLQLKHAFTDAVYTLRERDLCFQRDSLHPSMILSLLQAD